MKFLKVFKVALLLVLGSCSTTEMDPKSLEESGFMEEKPRTLSCIHTDLSKKLDFMVHFTRFPQVNQYHDSCIVDVLVMQKESGKRMDAVRLWSLYLDDYFFHDCNDVRSYTTGKNQFKETTDHFYGEFIVADFNFDSREDFALINDMGGNGGTFYSYFIQDENGKFEPDRFLTDSMRYFPTELRQKTKSLMTLIRADNASNEETIYQLNPETGTWNVKSSRIIEMQIK